MTEHRSRHVALHGNQLNSVKYAISMITEMTGNDETYYSRVAAATLENVRN